MFFARCCHVIILTPFFRQSTARILLFAFGASRASPGKFLPRKRCPVDTKSCETRWPSERSGVPSAAVSTPNLAADVTSDSSGNPATKGSRKTLTYARNPGYRSKLCGPEVLLVVHIELLDAISKITLSQCSRSRRRTECQRSSHSRRIDETGIIFNYFSSTYTGKDW